MRKIKSIIVLALLLLALTFIHNCGGAGHVTVGVGVYVPGAWGPYGGYGGGYYPPVGIGYPVY